MKVFGLSIPIVRGVPSELSLLAAALFGVLVWRLFRQRWLALGAFVTAGILPWLFVLGRTAITEAAAVPALLLLFLLAWQWAEENVRWHRALIAGVLLGLSRHRLLCHAGAAARSIAGERSSSLAARLIDVEVTNEFLELFS